jgi:hypothetical protein
MPLMPFSLSLPGFAQLGLVWTSCGRRALRVLPTALTEMIGRPAPVIFLTPSRRSLQPWSRSSQGTDPPCTTNHCLNVGHILYRARTESSRLGLCVFLFIEP